MRCLTWNLEWASPGGRRQEIIRKQIATIDPDVVCYTEVIRSIIPVEGYSIESDLDFGCKSTKERRKVILWSKNPWLEPDSLGDPKLPSGRYVSGITSGIRFIGICIPWRNAHVNTGRKDREPWEDHLTFCHALADILQTYSQSEVPICVLGDFNQRIPRSTQPKYVFEALLHAISREFTIVTEGIRDSDGNGLIDHLAISRNLWAKVEGIVPRIEADGTRLSDHVGVLTAISKIEVNETLEVISDLRD